MSGIRKFGGFKAMNLGRTLIVSLRILPSVLGDKGYVRRRWKIYISGYKIKRGSISTKLNFYEFCVYSILFMLFFIKL